MKIKIIIIFCALLPFAKQSMALKFLSDSEIMTFGYIFGSIYFLQGISSIGWSDLCLIKLTKDKSFKNTNINYFMIISITFIYSINLVLLPFFINDFNNLVLILLVISCSTFLTIFQLLNKTLRAYGFLNLFFYNLFIKNILDILIIIILIYFNKLNFNSILILEIITCILVILYYIRKKIIYRFVKFKYNMFEMKVHFLKNYKFAFKLFIMGILSSVLVFYDRIIYVYILPMERYNEYLFYNLIIMASLSLSAFIVSIAYSKLILLQKFDLLYIKKFLDIRILLLILFLILLSPLIYFTVFQIHEMYYSHIELDSFNLILIIIVFILNSSDFYEKYNMLTNNKNVLVLQFIIVCFIILVVFILYFYNCSSIKNLVMLYIFTKIVYILYNRKLIESYIE